jgi:hypothetical protein
MVFAYEHKSTPFDGNAGCSEPCPRRMRALGQRKKRRRALKEKSLVNRKRRLSATFYNP